MDNIILIGMPGSGKSSVGVVLAKALGMDFLDVDLLIQSREGALLQNILEEAGVLEERVPYENLVTTEYAEKAASSE